MVGEDAALPCRLFPKMSAETMGLMWERPSPRQVVYVYTPGQEDTPAAEYRGRTSVLREDVAAGKAALLIHNVTASDSGNYLCYFQDGDFYAKAQLELQVAALGSEPLVEMQGYEAGGVRVTCSSAGWHPRPRIEWRDARGQSLPAEVAPEAADAQGLYAAAASVILESGSGQGVSCVVSNPLLGQEKSARVSIAGPLFESAQPWKVALALSLVTLLLPLVGTGYLLRRQRKQIQALSQEEGRARAEKDAARAGEQREPRAQEKLQEALRWTVTGYRPCGEPSQACAEDVVLDVDTAQPVVPVPEDERSPQPAGGEKAGPAGQRGDMSYIPVCGAVSASRVETILGGGGGDRAQQEVGVHKADMERKC
ncbi:butyrophilin subfamily 3 member A2-like [Pteronotus mesoamericanus]|uniref:butyrophilin subfamily 3 member A2-like n=1 Tax=Pteronotus mesoamericanus TaxID=1884717 RepID=UPI0023ECD6A2|nr:butyrophilin subfamily 3 member A2-like [Pteronotus parnellii mesoamericanus]